MAASGESVSVRTLYYAHDPMCSWCWAFRPTWERICKDLPGDVRVTRLLGGLAPDSDAPMPAGMQQYLQQTWQRIQQVVPGTRFNFDFWHDCQPRRSTYRACRAVVAACLQDPAREEAMILAIQQAYYLDARNPSDADTLIALARDLALDAERFAADLDAPATQQELERQIVLAQRLGIQGFPGLILEQADRYTAIHLDYNEPSNVLAQLHA